MVGVVEGLVLTGRRLPPLECLGLLSGKGGVRVFMGLVWLRCGVRLHGSAAGLVLLVMGLI